MHHFPAETSWNQLRTVDRGDNGSPRRLRHREVVQARVGDGEQIRQMEPAIARVGMQEARMGKKMAKAGMCDLPSKTMPKEPSPIFLPTR